MFDIKNFLVEHKITRHSQIFEDASKSEIDYLAQTMHGKQIGSWKCDSKPNRGPGASGWAWTSPQYPSLEIYITPNWEGSNNRVSVQVNGDDGNHKFGEYYLELYPNNNSNFQAYRGFVAGWLKKNYSNLIKWNRQGLGTSGRL